MTTFKQLVNGSEPLTAVLALNPIMAKLAKQAGFKALYLSGGSLGYLNCILEANLTLPEMVQVAIDMRSVCDLPIILDGAAGWGDPMHMHRTIPLAEAAGFSAIEIEDQHLPKRAHHHVGVEELVPTEFMVEKIKEVVAARTNKDFVIIGRTNAAHAKQGMDDALRRGEAFRKAGADMLFVTQKHWGAEETRHIAERLGGPLMFMAVKGLHGLPMSPSELYDLGYRLIIEPASPLFAMYSALKSSYAAMAERKPDPLIGVADYFESVKSIHELIDMDKLLAIEKRTVLADR